MNKNPELYQLDTPQTLQHLKQVKVKVEPHLDDILASFFKFVQKQPKLEKFVANMDAEKLKKTHKNHFLLAMDSGLGDNYLASMHALARAYKHDGLEQHQLMSGYSYIVGEVLQLKKTKAGGAFKKGGTEPVLTHKDLDVFIRFLMFDVANSIEVYQEGKGNTEQVLETSVSFLNKLNGELEHVASSVTEMSSTVKEISDQATQAQDNATSVNEKMTAVNGGMEELEASSNKIGEVLNIIQEISEKINLLALNAAIEAARAGEHGRGFAVVADEIKKLANGTNKSIDDINEQINTIQGRIKHSTSDVGDVTDAIKQIEEINTSITAAVTEQSSATEEMEGFVQELLENASKTSEQLNQKTAAGGA